MNRRHINVLLVEDDEAHAELIQRAFEPRDGLVSMKVARTLREARAELASCRPDLALIDLLLPDGRGTDLLPASAGDDGGFPVVILTSQGDEEAAVEAMKAGALNYVVKSWETLSDIPQIVDGALREWGHVVERRRAEAALAARERHYRSLIENAQDVIAVVDRRNLLRYASPALERVLGWRPEERLGRDLLELVHAEDRPAVGRQLERTFRQPGSHPLEESRWQHRDGSLRFLEVIASGHREADGEQRVVINARDVSDRRRAEAERQQLEEQLRHSQRWEMIGTISGDIAAEFNNVLTPILGFAELALRSAADKRTRQGLERIVDAARRARQLSDQLLALSRQAEPQRKAIQLHLLIFDALKLLRASLPTTIDIHHRIDPDCAPVMADPAQLQQVLMNLCTNAHHAMRDSGGTLDLELAMVDLEERPKGARLAPGSYVRLSIRDTGHGMDPATRERALEPLFTTKGTGEKTGLGLSVTQAIVVSHGGELVVESEPGEGTAVHVYLPPITAAGDWLEAGPPPQDAVRLPPSSPPRM